jgi:hypothetical protein
LIVGVKQAFSSSPSSRGSSSRSGGGSQDSAWSLSFVPSPHETRGSIRYPTHDDVSMATDGDDISIHTTRVYDVNLLERVSLDEELPTILRIIGWGKLYDEPHPRSPSGTLGMWGATRVTMRVVVITPLMVTLSLASEPKPPPLLGTLIGMLFWSGMSVRGLTRLSAQWKGSDDSSNR